MTSSLIDRRRWLGASLLAAAVGPAPATAAAEPVRTALEPTAQTTEGPYYFDAGQQRAHISAGLAGVPLELRFSLLDTSGRRRAETRVDVWHCDARGIYSGYAGQGDERRIDTRGQDFLRGTQHSGTDGTAVFRTIYPGWYRGRTTHIHVKVFNGSRAVLTTQFFLPDALSEYLYTRLPDYARKALRDTLNSGDGIALQAGGSVIGAVHERADCYVASLDLVIDPAADPVVDRPPMPGDGPPTDARAGRPPPGGPRLRPGVPPGMGAALDGPERLAALVPPFKRAR